MRISDWSSECALPISRLAALRGGGRVDADRPQRPQGQDAIGPRAAGRPDGGRIVNDDELARLAPGSPDWANRLEQLNQSTVTPRRGELFRLADAVRGVLHRLVQTSAPIELISAAADQLSEVVATLEQHPYGSIYEGFAERSAEPT